MPFHRQRTRIVASATSPADTAVRFTQPTDLHHPRPCSGRVTPCSAESPLSADGSCVGCHPRDCHYPEGNYYARRRLETLLNSCPSSATIPGASSRRGVRLRRPALAGRGHCVHQRVHKLGPAPKFEDAKPMYVMPNLDLPAPLRPLGCGVNPAAMTELKDQIKAALEAKEVEFVMGWQKGFDGLHATPLYMRKPEDVEKLIWGPLNVHSLATYLPLFKGKKVGIVVKGCDSRGVVELLQENLINREDVVVFGMGCNGTIDINRVLAKIGDVTEVESVTGSGATLKVRADGKDYEFAMQDVAQDKCRACTVPNAVIHDHFAGSPTNIPDGAQPAMPAIMTFLDGLSLEDRKGFWRGHIDRCIRCYACRNACPMCVCRDNCVADSREPHWLTQEDSPTQKMFFQLIHAMHLAGRCTGCGECNRACPIGIPVGALKLQMGRVVKKLFEYAPGMDVDAVPPLLGFQLEEKNIHEHHIEGA
ncbi:MAG: 4Fe-4S dicluster domain-containing protein [Bilophila wadsworthia]